MISIRRQDLPADLFVGKSKRTIKVCLYWIPEEISSALTARGLRGPSGVQDKNKWLMVLPENNKHIRDVSLDYRHL